MYDLLKDDLEKALYLDCTRFTRLLAILRLFNIKARNGWIDKSIIELLELLNDMVSTNHTSI